MSFPFDLNESFVPPDDVGIYNNSEDIEDAVSDDAKECAADAQHSSWAANPQLSIADQDRLTYLRSKIDKPVDRWTETDVIGLTFDSVEDAHRFYNTYASVIGFSVRCQDKKYLRNGLPSMRLWVCSCNGKRRKTAPVAERSRAETRITRSNCLALFRVAWNPSLNLYQADKFGGTHSHDLAISDHVQFLRSHRHISKEQATQIEILMDAGIPKGQIVDYLLCIHGDSNAVGFTRKDVYNFRHSSKVPKCSTNDAGTAIAFIAGLAVKEPGIYCRYCANEENKLCRLFFADTISRTEYKHFGDVAICDATYKTNAFHMPLVIFTGVDNNLLNIVFAFAIINCEDAETYGWVFKTFLDCMGGVAPKAILTDADKAMQVAIRETMPSTKHRWCSWHIVRNLSGISTEPDFKKDFCVLMFKNYNIDDLRIKWELFLQKYNLSKKKDKWAEQMNGALSLWPEAFFRGVFFGGMNTTQRAESFNAYIKKFVQVELQLIHFIQKYYIGVDRIRSECMRHDCITANSAPAYHGVFKQVHAQLARLYTSEVMKRIEDEMVGEVLFASEQAHWEPSGAWTAKVVKYGVAEGTVPVFTVNLTPSGLSCSCGMLVTHGWPCRHVFSALKSMQVVCIPDANICARWTQRIRRMPQFTDLNYHRSSGTDRSHRYAALQLQCLQVTHYGSSNAGAFEYANAQLTGIANGARQRSIIQVDKERYTQQERNHDQHPPTVIRDPGVVKTKGAPKKKQLGKCNACGKRGHSRSKCALSRQTWKSEISPE